MDGRPNRRNKAAFRDGLVWAIGLTVEIKLRFRDGLVWMVGLTLEIKLRFCDMLVSTVSLTVDCKTVVFGRRKAP